MIKRITSLKVDDQTRGVLNYNFNALATPTVVPTNLGQGLVSGTDIPLTSSTGTGTTLLSASETLAGLLSAVDKTKLNGVESGAQVNVGTDIAESTRTIDSVLITSSTGADATLSTATSLFAGVMASADKSKLDGIATGANAYTHPSQTAIDTNAIDNGLNVIDRVQVDTAGHVTAVSTRNLSLATTLADGAMASADKSKLDGIAAGAQVNTGKNLIINGNFDVWQRGTSFTAAGYGADRWTAALSGGSFTMSAQAFTLGQTDVDGNPWRYLRTVVTAGTATTSFFLLNQRIENVHEFSGEWVTLSFYAKANSARSIAVNLRQFFGTGGSSTVFGDSHVVSITTGWVRYGVTLWVPSISGKTFGAGAYLMINFFFSGGSGITEAAGIGNQSGTYEIARVQLERGTVGSTSFEERTLAQEIALCQRYYFKIDALRGTMNNYATAYAMLNSIAYPQEMRVAPTLTVIANPTAVLTTLGSLYSTTASKTHLGVIYNVTSGLAGRADMFNAFSAHVDAEL